MSNPNFFMGSFVTDKTALHMREARVNLGLRMRHPRHKVPEVVLLYNAETERICVPEKCRKLYENLVKMLDWCAEYELDVFIHTPRDCIIMETLDIKNHAWRDTLQRYLQQQEWHSTPSTTSNAKPQWISPQSKHSWRSF